MVTVIVFFMFLGGVLKYFLVVIVGNVCSKRKRIGRCFYKSVLYVEFCIFRRGVVVVYVVVR